MYTNKIKKKFLRATIGQHSTKQTGKKTSNRISETAVWGKSKAYIEQDKVDTNLFIIRNSFDEPLDYIPKIETTINEIADFFSGYCELEFNFSLVYYFEVTISKNFSIAVTDVKKDKNSYIDTINSGKFKTINLPKEMQFYIKDDEQKQAFDEIFELMKSDYKFKFVTEEVQVKLINNNKF